MLWQITDNQDCVYAVFPTLKNQIWPNLLKSMATMANFFHKYGHNMATFLMNFDPIFSFYCIFMQQFSKKFQIGERNLQFFFGKTSKQKMDFLLHF